MKRSIFQIVGLLLLLPLFSGCNDSDDVAAIFTGKTWKLNYITVDGGHEMFGFWENEEQEKASIKELNKNGTYNMPKSRLASLKKGTINSVPIGLLFF